MGLNLPQVTKNLLILNVLLFLLTFFFQTKGVDLGHLLGAHYVNSPAFKPFQIVTHFFMHGDLMHILFNMIGVVMFGSFLERLWGPKRFFILYLSAAIGAFALYNAMGVYQIIHLREIMPADVTAAIDQVIRSSSSRQEIAMNMSSFTYNPRLVSELDIMKYYEMVSTPMVGASGALFGIMAAFAILFPNTELQLMFIPIPIKAKFLIGGYFAYELYYSIYQVAGDNIAHLAHVGGAVVGAALVLIWRRKRTDFY